MINNPPIVRTIIVRGRHIPEPIEEESLTNKIMACIPLLGTERTHLIEVSIHEKIQKTQESNTMIRLIQLKNSYKTIAITRMILTMGFSWCIVGDEWRIPFGIILTLGFLPPLYTHGRSIIYNRQTIKAIIANDLDSIRPAL